MAVSSRSTRLPEFLVIFPARIRRIRWLSVGLSAPLIFFRIGALSALRRFVLSRIDRKETEERLTKCFASGSSCYTLRNQVNRANEIASK